MKETAVKLKDPRTCRIFFSSPFGGMEEEREELTKKYFPQIHHACNVKGIKFVPVDMRWGITKEAADNAQVMDICLREVERSDYFVGFFGQRYGWHSMHGGSTDPILQQNFDNAMISYPWVDKYRDRSMTEVEWRLGHLNNPGDIPACFCFRDKEYDDAQCSEAEKNGQTYLKAKFSSENQFASKMLQLLIEEVLATEDQTYGVKTSYKTPQEGAKFIFDKIWHFVNELVLKDVNEDAIPDVLKLRQVHDQFAKSMTNLYCGCLHYFDILDTKIDDADCKGVLVTGPAGSGKSSLLANWVHSVQKKCPHLAVIYHYIGCAPGTERPKTILERLLLELKSAFPAHGDKTPEPDKDKDTPRDPDGNEIIVIGDGIKNVGKTDVTQVNGFGDALMVNDHDGNCNSQVMEEENGTSSEDKDANGKLTSSSVPSLIVTMDANLAMTDDKKDLDEAENINVDLEPLQGSEKRVVNAAQNLAEDVSKPSGEDVSKPSGEDVSKPSGEEDSKPILSGSENGEHAQGDKIDGNVSDQNLENQNQNGLDKDPNVPQEDNKSGTSSDKKEDSSKDKNNAEVNASDDKNNDKATPEQKKSSQQLLNEVKALLKSISEHGEKVVIVIDALNQQQKMEKTRKHLYWLPEQFPDEVSFICCSLDSDSATHDLLVQQRGMEALLIEPYSTELQLNISVESLKLSGKELSPHQLNRIVDSSETTNPLFLKLILYELSIYGNFRKLDEKIDSLIYVNGVKPLLQVILSRIEEDYNLAGYEGNLVKDVLCCLIASKKGLSESEMVKILSIPLTLWSPLFFALEHLLVQYTGLLGFAFLEVRDAVIERYLIDPSDLNSYKERLITYFDALRQTMKPWEKNSGLEYNRVLEELPWLQQDIEDKESLIQTLSDISIMKKLVNTSCNDLLELWQSTGTSWSTVTSLYMKEFDSALVSLYEEQQEGVIDDDVSPGIKMRVTLQYLRSFFDTAYYPDGNIKFMQREIHILENCQSKYTPEKAAEYLRDSRYYLAVGYADRQIYDKALPLYCAIMEECEKILKDKEDSAAQEMLAYSCNGTGLVYYGTQNYSKALEYLERSESIHKSRNEQRHQASSRTNIGLVYVNQKEYTKALDSFDEAKRLYEDHFFGEMPLDIGNLLTNIALTYRRMKNLDKAEEFYHKSLAMKAKNVGWYHPVIAVAFMNLGTLEVHRKNHAEAEEWTRKAINIYELNEVPITDKSHRMCRENLCMNMLKQKRHAELVPLYLEVTNILVDNGWIGECIPALHRDMLEYVINKFGSSKYAEVEKILLAILASPKRRAYFANHLITLDNLLEKEKRPQRPEDLTLLHFVTEYPSDSKLQISYVTDYLAEKNMYDTILSVCLGIHDRESAMKESAFSFAADTLASCKHYESAKRILQEGFDRYPDHLELVDVMIRCLIALEEASDLILYVPAILEAPDWELLSQRNLMECAKALESIDVGMARKCYTKLIQEGNSVSQRTAIHAMKRLFPGFQSSDVVPSQGDPKDTNTT